MASPSAYPNQCQGQGWEGEHANSSRPPQFQSQRQEAPRSSSRAGLLSRDLVPSHPVELGPRLGMHFAMRGEIDCVGLI